MRGEGLTGRICTGFLACCDLENPSHMQQCEERKKDFPNVGVTLWIARLHTEEASKRFPAPFKSIHSLTINGQAGLIRMLRQNCAGLAFLEAKLKDEKWQLDHMTWGIHIRFQTHELDLLSASAVSPTASACGTVSFLCLPSLSRQKSQLSNGYQWAHICIHQ